MDVLHNETLIAAIAEMNTRNDRASREAVLDLIITQGQFLAPVKLLPGESGEQNIQFTLLPNQTNQPFFPAFTSWDELRKLCGPQNQQTLVMTFDQYAGMILKDNRAAGFVVDPFGCCLSFERTMVSHLVQRKGMMAPPQ